MSEPLTPTEAEQHAIRNRQIGAWASVVFAVCGATGINVAPEHAQVIGTVFAVLIPCLPSIWGALRRRA